MISDLKPYPTVKDSGVECLGKVPAHWDVTSLRRRLRPFDGIKIGPFGSQLKLDQMTSSGYKVYGQGNVISKDFKRGTKFVCQEKFEELSACEVLPGDLLVTMMGTSGRCAGVPTSAALGIMDSHLLRLRTDQRISARFAALLIDESPYMKEQITVAGKGSIMHGLNSGIIKALFVAVPPLAEQTAIVRFLDHADRRIQSYIPAKQKLIALLEEQKQAIIHQAVTGQIDVRTGQPYPLSKNSGVEWLGDVPEHWEVVPLRRVSIDSCDGPFGSGLKSSHYTEQGIRVVRLQNIGHGEFKDFHAAFISPEYYSSLGDHSVISGDVLIAGLGDNNHPAGRACVAPENIIPAMVKADCFRFRLDQARIQPQFAALQLTATATVASTLLSNGATRQRTNLQATSGRAIGIPSVPEQNLIVKYITAEVSGTAGAQVAIQREIELLLEYRTRLIADVVTGKLDVRKAAADLLCETETHEPSDPLRLPEGAKS